MTTNKPDVDFARKLALEALENFRIGASRDTLAAYLASIAHFLGA
jgi:hypothetical protein